MQPHASNAGGNLRRLSGNLRRLSGSCSPGGGSCLYTECCAEMFETCFLRDSTLASCMSSCRPGALDPNNTKPWSCQTPFADPRAIARKTETWPDIAAVCSPGMALVYPDAFRSKYNGSCKNFCVHGAGKFVWPEGSFYKQWISVEPWGADEVAAAKRGHCLGQKAWGSNSGQVGTLCHCSFPDRL